MQLLKKAAAIATRASGRLDEQRYKLIVQVCDEILAGEHHDMFPRVFVRSGSVMLAVERGGDESEYVAAPDVDASLGRRERPVAIMGARAEIGIHG